MSNEVDKLLFTVAKNGYDGASPIGWKDVRTVAKLPKIGESGILYKVPKEGNPNNLYTEYVWTGISFKIFMENVDSDESATSGGDANTTYTLSLDPNDPHTVVLTGSDGSRTSATVEDKVNIDTNTTYTLTVANNKITLTPSEGDAMSFDIPVQDVSGFATKEALSELEAKIPTVPAPYDDSEIKAELATKADKSEIPTDYVTDETVTDKIDTFANQLSNVAKTGSYSDLTATPTKLSDFTNDAGFITAADVKADTNTTYSLTQDEKDPHTLHFTGSDDTNVTIIVPDSDTVYDDTALKAEIEAKADSSSISKVGTTGAYTDLVGAPTAISDFQNDVGFVTSDTTYTLEQDATDGHTFTLKGSNGYEKTITIPDVNIDTDTTYTLDVKDGTITLTPSNGEAMSFNIPVQDVSGFAKTDAVDALTKRVEALEAKVAELEGKLKEQDKATISESGVVKAPEATIADNGTVTLPSATIDTNGIVTI